MRFHCLQHVSYEGPVNIEKWAISKGYAFTRTEFYKSDWTLPDVGAYDWLVIMGGPMNIHEEEQYPWLTAEKRFIKEALQHQKIILGICLGAQLIADSLGAKVSRSPYPEIGWFPVALTEEARKHPLMKGFTRHFIAFHWHEDAFDIPQGAIHLVESDACRNQAFIYNDRVVGLQFHPEMSHEAVELMLSLSPQELPAGEYVQSKMDMETQAEFYLWEEQDNLKQLMINMENYCTVKG